MKFNVKVLENRKSLGLQAMTAENIAQAESGLLELLQQYLDFRPADVRCLYEVKADDLRRILLYAWLENDKRIRLRVEIKLVV